MKKITTIKCLLTLTATALLVLSCATRNINPAQARANTGYVDLHAVPAGELCWQVACFDDRKQAFQPVFSELEPPAGGILRLACSPGHHRLRVTFMNRVIVNPVEFEVEVQDGKITPVRVTLTAAGTAFVQTKETSPGGTAKGRYGRRTKISSDETTTYGLSTVAEPPVTYQLKEQMPYAH